MLSMTCPRLQVLMLDNQLSALPKSLGQQANLERGWMRCYMEYRQKLRHISQVPPLQVLMLDDNQLSAHPISLGQLTKLEQLSVAGDQLH